MEVHLLLLFRMKKYCFILFLFSIIKVEVAICQNELHPLKLKAENVGGYNDGYYVGDSLGNMYSFGYIYNLFWLNDSTQSIVVSPRLVKRNSLGQILWDKRYPQDSGDFGWATFVCVPSLHKNKLYSTLRHTGNLQFEDTVLPATNNPLNLKSYFTAYDTNGNLLDYKYYGQGLGQVDLFTNSVFHFDSFHYIFGSLTPGKYRFADGSEIENFAAPPNQSREPVVLKFDSNLNLIKYKHFQLPSKIGWISTRLYNKGSNIWLLGNLSDSTLVQDGDTLRIKTNAALRPVLLILNKDLTLKKFSVLEPDFNPAPQSPIIIRAHTIVLENADILAFLRFKRGTYRFGDLTLEAIRDDDHFLVRLDSNLTIQWAIPLRQTIGGQIPSVFQVSDTSFYVNMSLKDSITIRGTTFNLGRRNGMGLLAHISINGRIVFATQYGSTAQRTYGMFTKYVSADNNRDAYVVYSTGDQARGEFGCLIDDNQISDPMYSQVVWFKAGRCRLRRDSIQVQPAGCSGSPLPRVQAWYSSSLGGVGYAWSTGDSGQVFQPAAPGSYSLVVTDASCCADTVHFTIPSQWQLPQAQLVGNGTALLSTPQTYSINGADSLQASWQVTGGNILEGQSTDSILVQWSSQPPWQVVGVLRHPASGCYTSDTLNIVVLETHHATIHPWRAWVNEGKLHVYASGKVEVEVRDLTGRSLGTTTLNPQGSEVLYDLKLSSNGIYLLKLVHFGSVKLLRVCN